MYIYRQLENQLSPFLKRREVIAIIGPRQAGKTTFIEYLADQLKNKNKKIKFITFENRSDLRLFDESIDDFKELIKSYDFVIIDEFQYAEDGGQKLKYLYDTLRGVKFIISGSSSLELTFQTGKYMVGRLLEFEMLPFSFREFLSAKNRDLANVLKNKNISDMAKFNIKNGFGAEINRRLTNLLEEYVVWGGYPAAVLAKNQTEKQKILEGIVEKYLLKDIQDLLHLSAKDDMERLSKLLAAQIGNMIKYEELSISAGLAHKDVKKYLDVLRGTYIAETIKPFYTNKRTELVKNPKVYFFDLGLRNFLLTDFRKMADRQDAGAVMENYAYVLLRRLYPMADLKYWRTKSKAEVDFIVESEGRILPIEIKYGSKKIIGKSLYSFIEKFNPPIAIILTKDYLGEEKIDKTKVKFIPLSYF